MITFYATCIILYDFPMERIPTIYHEKVISEVVNRGYPEKVGVYPEETSTKEPEIDEQPVVNAK